MHLRTCAPAPACLRRVPHAPPRSHGLTKLEKRKAVENALRYFSAKHHVCLASEFLMELETFGHIYMYL